MSNEHLIIIFVFLALLIPGLMKGWGKKAFYPWLILFITGLVNYFLYDTAAEENAAYQAYRSAGGALIIGMIGWSIYMAIKRPAKKEK